VIVLARDDLLGAVERADVVEPQVDVVLPLEIGEQRLEVLELRAGQDRQLAAVLRPRPGVRAA
jgi:hypothetical protein